MSGLIDAIDSRFKSLNSVPVRDVRMTHEEWSAIKHSLLESKKDLKDVLSDYQDLADDFSNLATEGCHVCGEVYQVVGVLWDGADSRLAKVLDNLSASSVGKTPPHKTLLPFIQSQPVR